MCVSAILDERVMRTSKSVDPVSVIKLNSGDMFQITYSCLATVIMALRVIGKRVL